MATDGELNQVLDLIIALLAIILFILLFRGGRGFKSRPHKVELMKQQKELEGTRRRTLDSVGALVEERGKLQRMESESKRRYMKGEITWEAMQLISDDAERRMADIEGRLSKYDGFY